MRIEMPINKNVGDTGVFTPLLMCQFRFQFHFHSFCSIYVYEFQWPQIITGLIGNKQTKARDREREMACRIRMPFKFEWFLRESWTWTMDLKCGWRWKKTSQSNVKQNKSRKVCNRKRNSSKSNHFSSSLLFGLSNRSSSEKSMTHFKWLQINFDLFFVDTTCSSISIDTTMMFVPNWQRQRHLINEHRFNRKLEIINCFAIIAWRLCNRRTGKKAEFFPLLLVSVLVCNSVIYGFWWCHQWFLIK